MQNRNILIVEDNYQERFALCKKLESWGYLVTAVCDGNDAEKKYKPNMFRLVIMSYEIHGLSSVELFKKWQSESNHTKFLFFAHHASVEDAVAVMKAGALDFIIKPIHQVQIKHCLQRVFSPNGNRSDSSIKKTYPVKIVTQHKTLLRLLDLANQIADSNASVLIQGESGTGKEVFARFIHQNSRRRNKPFVAVNCGALPESLLESELFGHEKGAFTGAISKKPGKFELANEGTILLDEITEMQCHLQSKLLRVLQEREVDRVGGLHPIQVDVRVIATTNRDIKKAIAKGEFREDLFYRLNVIPIRIPPLRERQEDIVLLAQHFIKKYNRINNRSVENMTEGAINKLIQLPFNGNVRELENIIERAVLLSDGLLIREEDLLLEEPVGENDVNVKASDFHFSLINRPLKETEKKIIFHTLDQTNGNRTHAAKILGISVRTLRNKLNEYKEQIVST